MSYRERMDELFRQRSKLSTGKMHRAVEIATEADEEIKRLTEENTLYRTLHGVPNTNDVDSYWCDVGQCWKDWAGY